MKYENKRNKLRIVIDELRAKEILWTMIKEINNDNFDENDFNIDKNELLKRLWEIDINKYPRYIKTELLEDDLINLFGENILLYIVPKSDLIIKLEKLKEKVI